MKFINFAVLIFLVGCSSFAEREKPPALELRTLKISKQVPGFEYQFRECVKSGIFGGCRKWETKTEYFDLRNPEVRDKLLHMGFVAIVEEKVLQ